MPCMLQGVVCRKTDTEAVRWFHKAAEQGEARSQGRLCASYGFGSGVPQDYVQAYAWCNLAAARGEEPRDAVCGG